MVVPSFLQPTKRRCLVLNKLVKFSAVVTLAFAGSSVLADGHDKDQPYPTFGIETYACNYNEGKDLGDLLKVSEKWSQWATETLDTPYSAWLFTPMFFDKAPEFDVYWLGSSDSMVTLGAVQDQWIKTGAKYQKEFNKVMTCDRHTMFEGQTLRFNLDSLASGNAQFFGCNFKEGATPEKFVAGTKAFRAFVDTLELKEGIWRWWPSAGHLNQPPFDFLEVVGSASLEERFANKGKYDDSNGNAVWFENNADNMQCAYVADANYIQVK